MHLQQLKGMHPFKVVCGRGFSFVNRAYTEGELFLWKVAYKGWGAGPGRWALPFKILLYTPCLWPFFSKWNWFVQMVNAIPGRNIPVLNFACNVNGKQSWRSLDTFTECQGTGIQDSDQQAITWEKRKRTDRYHVLGAVGIDLEEYCWFSHDVTKIQTTKL